MQPSKIQKLGPISHFSDLGNAIIIDPPKLPKIGSDVMTEQMLHIGTVMDIFGPINKPYLSVRVKPQYREKLDVGIVLYGIRKRQMSNRRKKRPTSSYKKPKK